MTKFRSIQNSLAYGYISEEMAGRTDLAFYKQACSELQNFVVEPAGGIRKRAGFRAINFYTPPISDIQYRKVLAIKGSSDLILYSNHSPLIHIVDSNMNLKYQASYNIRFGTIIQMIQIGDLFIATMTNSPPIVLYHEGVSWFVKTIGTYLLRNALASSLITLAQEYRFLPFQPWNIDQSLTIEAAATTGNTTLTAKKGTNPYPLFYALEEVDSLIASNYLVSTTWSKALWKKRTTTITSLNLTGLPSGGWSDSGGDVITDNSSFTIKTLSWFNGIEVDQIYVGSEIFVKKVGAEYKIATSFDNLVAGIYIAASGTTLTAEVCRFPTLNVTTIISPANTSASYVWSFPQWSVERGFPKRLTFVGTRLVVAGTDSDNEAIWMSNASNNLQFNNLRFKMDENASSSYVGLYGAIAAYDAHLTRATSAQFNRISWMLNAQELTIGCEGGLFILNRSTNGDYQPLQTTSSALSFDSSKDIDPTMMEFGIVFVDKTGKKIMFVDYRAEKQIVTELSLMVNNEFSNITKIIYHRSTKTLWIVDNNTTLYSFTLSSFTNVAGFAKQTHPLEGKAGFTLNDVFTDSDDELCILYTETATQKLAFFRLEAHPNTGEKVFLDGYHTLTHGVSSTTWDFRSQDASIDYREGETVTCLVDGVQTTGKVRDGVVTTLIPGLSIVLGTSYLAKMKTLNLDVGGSIGSSIGAIKRVDEVALKFKDSRKVRVGGTTLFPIKAAESALFSGEVVEKVAASPNSEAFITVESSDPFPCQVIYLVYKGFTQE